MDINKNNNQGKIFILNIKSAKKNFMRWQFKKFKRKFFV